ncbi:MAG: hypothetical protein LAN84_16050 [Acidobacteriia bacterium]|nr:hypothetical protein [Terriglobia bacterium]
MTHQIQINQSELQEISDLQRELAWKEKHLDEMKNTLMVLLREGVPIEKGRFDARLITRVGRPVPWKQLFIERIGQAAADLIKRTFKSHVYYEVQVTEHAVLPLWQGRESSEGEET